MSTSTIFPSRKERFASAARTFFPTPTFLAPRACGIDISDASIKWMTLSRGAEGGRKVEAWGEHPLAPGIVETGLVQDARALAEALREVAPHIGNASVAHAALPEEAAYVFGMHVPEGAPHEQIAAMIEFEFNGRVPIPPASAMYDFSVIQTHDDGQGEEISVTVFPRDISESYAEAFAGAGVELMSLELEARSIARAVSSERADEPITLLVDFGRERSGIAVLKHGVPIFTSSVEIGGDPVIAAVQKALSMDAKAARKFSNDEGLLPSSGMSAGAEAVIGTASSLSDEIARYYQYWDTRRNEHGERMTPVGNIVLVGGGANLNGLPEYIAGRVQAPVEQGNIWRHIADFDEYIPPIDHRTSLQFATAAGLALRGI